MRIQSPLFPILLFLIAFAAIGGNSASGAEGDAIPAFPPPVQSYQDDGIPGLGKRLLGRIKQEPFNAVGTGLFLAAIVHTFLVARFRRLSHHYEQRYDELEKTSDPPDETTKDRLDSLQLRAVIYHFLGEIEAVFGIWLLPLFVAIILMKGMGAAVHYVDGINYSEAIFVTVIMTMAASRPVIAFAESWLARVAKLLGGTPTAWWLTILTVGPLIGSFITEPAAMTLCAMLLSHRFYGVNPSQALKYATLGLLFVNISVGGTLSHFAAPPVVMVASKWNYDLPYMFLNFGWKAVIGIAVSTALCWLVFRKQLAALESPSQTGDGRRPVPAFPTFVHLLFLAWTVYNAHHPSLVIFGFLFFLAYAEATDRHQHGTAIRGPLLVGFFLAALVVHGGCQQWWIQPVLTSLTKTPLMIGSVVLTAFNDNAAITYLASLVPDLGPELKYAVLAGAVTGGGLTVIANAPNPAGQSLLQKHFGEEGISPAKLFLAAVVPTIIVGLAFMLLP